MAQSHPQEPDFRRPGPKSAPADPGRTRRAGGEPGGARASCFGAKQPRARRVSEMGASSPSSPRFPRESMPRLPRCRRRSALPLIPHGRRADASPPAHAYTRAWLYKPVASLASGHTAELYLSRAPPPSPPSPSPDGRTFPRRRGGGQRLRPPLAPRTGVVAPVRGQHPGPAGHAHRADGVEAQQRGSAHSPLPDAVARPNYFAAGVEIVRASLTDEQLALPQYAADNHTAWAAYFERRQQQRLASTNGAPVVGGTKNSEGRHLWWGVPGRTLEGVLTHLEGGNNPPLAYPPPARAAAPAHRRRAGQWMPRRFGSSSSSSSHSSSRASSHSSGSPALLGVKAEWRGSASTPPCGGLSSAAGAATKEESSSWKTALPPPVRVGDAGQGSTRDGRVKEEKAAADDGGEDGDDDGDYSAFSDFFF
nr:serine/arginine repetitive matrix protein 1-like [Aegilops tauschii subsp. strangulata]